MWLTINSGIYQKKLYMSLWLPKWLFIYILHRIINQPMKITIFDTG